MKRPLIFWIGLYFFMISTISCIKTQYAVPGCYPGIGSYTQVIKISIRDKQTGQIIPHAVISLTKSKVEVFHTPDGCLGGEKVLEQITVQPDISGQYEFQYSDVEHWRPNSLELVMHVTADQYEPVKVSRSIKAGFSTNEIIIEMLNNVNQP